MYNPEFQRELIRLANRDRQDANGVIDLIIFAGFAFGRPDVRYDLIEPQDIFDLWKGSFDGDFEP